MKSSNQLDEILTRCRYYRTVCSLDAVARGGAEGIVLRVGNVGAVVVPQALGRRTLARLPYPGPIVVSEDRREQPQWTLLTSPAQRRLEAASLAMLSLTDARLLSAGDEIRLPAPHDVGRTWLNGLPTDAYRPSSEDVVEAIRAARFAR
ncbi:hypothetical protein ACW2Q0_21290 [Nocardia sp. R16R-3T]